MTEKDYVLAFIQILPIIVIWIRLESRMSRLEGRFDMFFLMCEKTFKSEEKGH